MLVQSLHRDLCVHTSTSALSACGDLIWITSEAAYELSNPLHSRALVVKAVVCFVTCLAQFFGSRKAREAQSVAIHINTCIDILKFLKDPLDGDTDNGFLPLDRHPHYGGRVIVWVPTTSNSKSASMYEDKDRQLRVGVNSTIFVRRHSDVEIQAFEIRMRRNFWEWQ